MKEGIPSWLTNEFLETVLAENTDELEIVVEGFTIESAVDKGNNFVCDILRIKVQYRTSKTSNRSANLIVKNPRTGGLHDLIVNLGVVEKELKIYNELVPKINYVMKGEKLFPSNYKTNKEDVLIMEDLKHQGFEMVDRKKQLDYDHCVVALKALAKFHAASVKVYEKDSDLIESVGKEVIYRDEVKEVVEMYFTKVFALVGDVISTWEESKHYKDKISGYEDVAWGMIQELLKPKSGELIVLNHGDFWITNMLFKYSNGSPVQVKLLDLQVSRYTSPALDLLYFMASTVKEDVRIKKHNDLISIYIETLNSELRNHGINQTLHEQDLRNSMREREFFFLHASLTILPMIISDVEVINIKEMREDEFKSLEYNPYRGYLETKTFRKVFSGRLEELKRNGFFEKF